jgi:hypothetical protein
MGTAVCTIISRNYLPYARVLAESLQMYHPGWDFYVLMVDGVDAKDGSETFEVINVAQLNLPNLQHLAFRYNRLELNTNVKPTFLAYLFAEKRMDKLLYLDPDILICGSLSPLFDLLDRHGIVLTPHCTSPIESDEQRPSEVDFLLVGVFNLGFIGLRRSEQTEHFLSWWEKRCLNLGYSELRSGLFVDQKWINLVPCFFDSVYINRDLGCNVAYWNLHERTITRVDGHYVVNGQHMLRFFHFSGIDIEDESQLSRHSSRHSLRERPDVAPLFQNYRERVFGRGYSNFKNCAYCFGSFSDGSPVTQIARSAFAISEGIFPDDDPFSTKSDFYRWARSRGLLGTTDTSGEYTFAAYKKATSQVRMANKLLSGLLRTVGPNRYTIFMKYLSFISVLRNQPGVLSPDKPRHRASPFWRRNGDCAGEESETGQHKKQRAVRPFLNL